MRRTLQKREKRKSHTFWSALDAVRLHRNVRVQVVKSAVRLFASIPAAFVHSLNFFISSSRALVLLRAGNWNE